MSEREVRDVVNQVLHGAAKPCEAACTHVIVGSWTALGIANMVERADVSERVMRESLKQARSER